MTVSCISLGLFFANVPRRKAQVHKRSACLTSCSMPCAKIPVKNVSQKSSLKKGDKMAALMLGKRPKIDGFQK